MQSTFLALLAASSAYASPVFKRQQVSSAASSLISSASAAASSAAAPTLTSASIASSAVRSLASSARSASASSSSRASASASASASAAPIYPGYPCPSGSFLSYVELQQNYNEALDDITAIVGNFTNATWLNIINPSGSDTVGATRTLQFNNATTVEEVLVNKTINPDTLANYQNWNLTGGPVQLTGLTIYNYSTVLQAYVNDTLTSTSAPVTTVKLFSNFCTDRQAAGIAALTEYFRAALGNIETSSPVATSSASGIVPSSVISSAASSASRRASSASSRASSARSSASSRVSSAISSASAAVPPAPPAPSSGPPAPAPSGPPAPAPSSAPAPSTPAGPAGGLLINTPPSIIQCQPALISFSGGQAPYILSVLPGGQSSAAALAEFPSQPTAGTFTWVVNLPAGTAVTLSIRDGTGLVNYSSIITVLASSDRSCLPA